MPVHDFRCPKGHVTEQFVPHGAETIPCGKCAQIATKVFLTPPMGFVQRDICYDSPIDGRPVTSKYARIEDLARSGCVEYDPGMRQDAARRRQEAEQRLDRALDETVEAALAVMDTRKREQLAAELSSGADVEVARGTPTIN